MKILIDETFHESLAGLFNALGDEAFAIRNSHLKSISDREVAERAREYDCLLTLDLHRDQASWLAVHRLMLNSGAKMVRVRLPKRIDSPEMLKQYIVQSITRKLGEWKALLANGACVVMISRLGEELRAQSPEDIRAMLAKFDAVE